MKFRLFKGRSPLRGVWRRRAGESAGEEFELHFGMAMTLVCVAIFSIISLLYISLAPHQLTQFLWVAIVICGIAAVWFWRRGLAYRKGSAAEAEVGELLDEMRKSGAVVFHDVQGRGFNIDHVLIDATGVYVIETKYIRKPDRGPVNIKDRDGKLMLNNRPMIVDPRPQAARNARDVSHLIRQLGYRIEAQPIVMIPGWFVEEDQIPGEVWVINPSRIFAKIRARPQALGKDRIDAIAAALKTMFESAGPLLRRD